MKVSVIIPTFNRRESVLRAVRSVFEQDFPGSEYEVIAVVDGGRDDTAQALRRMDSDRRLRIVEQENRGLPGARNSGARVANGELLVFLDDDMICTPGWLSAHVAAHESGAEGEIVGLGAIYIADDHPQNLAAEMFRIGQGSHFLSHRERPDDPWPANAWSFGNTSIKRLVLEALGGFDEQFRMREDCELGARLVKAGIRQRFVADGVAYQWCHKRPKELLRDAETFADYDLLFLKKHPGWMPHEFLTKIRRESSWKRAVRHWLSGHTGVVDAVLGPLCAIGDWIQMPGLVRKAALRALLFQCGLHWYGRMREISGVLPEELVEESSKSGQRREPLRQDGHGDFRRRH